MVSNAETATTAMAVVTEEEEAAEEALVVVITIIIVEVVEMDEAVKEQNYRMILKNSAEGTTDEDMTQKTV